MKILVTRKKNSFFSFFFFHPDYKYTPTSLLKLSVYLSVQISKKEGKMGEGGGGQFKIPLNNPQLFSSSRHSYNLNHRDSHNLQISFQLVLSPLSLPPPSSHTSHSISKKKGKPASSDFPSFSIREIHRITKINAAISREGWDRNSVPRSR